MSSLWLKVTVKENHCQHGATSSQIWTQDQESISEEIEVFPMLDVENEIDFETDDQSNNETDDATSKENKKMKIKRLS